MRFRHGLLIALAAAILCAPFTSRAADPINSYTVKHLGAFDSYGLNDFGQVVGGNGQAILWQNGGTTVLPSLGGNLGIAQAINRFGQVVGGSALIDGTTRAFYWDALTGIKNLGTLGGMYSRANGINDSGQVVGVAETGAGQYRAFLWRSSTGMVSLGTLNLGVGSVATAINSGGQVTGYSWDSTGQTRAFRWSPTAPNGTVGTMVALEGNNGIGWGINGFSEVAGQNASAPAVWDSVGAHNLPADPYIYGYYFFFAGGTASAINDSRTVVGTDTYAIDYGDWGYSYYDRAYSWDSMHGSRPLHELVGQSEWFTAARAINSVGQIAAQDSSGACLLTPSPIPSPPGFLTASVGDAQVRLTWGPSSGAERYTVKRSTISGGPYSPIITGVTGTSFTDTAVTNGVTYYYVVSGTNGFGESADSPSASARPISPPARPTGLAATGGDQFVSLAWNAAAGADYYLVYRSATVGGPYSQIASTTDLNVIDYGDWWDGGTYPLVNGTTYYYVVTAVNSAAESLYSDEAYAAPVAPPPPSAPTGLVAAPGDQRVTLTWNEAPGATMYWVKRATASGGPYSKVNIVYGTTSVDVSLTNGTKYYYVVSALNNGGESPNSTEASATPLGPPPPAAPTRLTASANGKKKVTLAWTQSVSPGITQNRIYRSTTSGTGYSLLASIGAGTSYNDSSVASKVKYFYAVTAVASGKESALSNQAAVTTK